MKDVYKDRYGKDIPEDSVKQLYSVAVSIFAIGGMLGGFSGGMIANRFGRLIITFSNHFKTSNNYNLTRGNLYITKYDDLISGKEDYCSIMF